MPTGRPQWFWSSLLPTSWRRCPVSECLELPNYCLGSLSFIFLFLFSSFSFSFSVPFLFLFLFLLLFLFIFIFLFIFLFAIEFVLFGSDFGCLRVQISSRNGTTKKEEEKKVEMRKLQIALRRPIVKRKFLCAVLRSWKRVFFIHAFFSFMDVLFGRTPPTQLRFLVAFVGELLSIIGHISD